MYHYSGWQRIIKDCKFDILLSTLETYVYCITKCLRMCIEICITVDHLGVADGIELQLSLVYLNIFLGSSKD